MKKLFTLIVSICLTCTLFLTGCVNQGMADKINEKANSDKGYSYQSLIDDYGTPTVGYISPEKVPVYSGIVIYLKGCDSLKEANEKFDKGKKVKAVYVDIRFNVVKSATYKTYTKE